MNIQHNFVAFNQPLYQHQNMTSTCCGLDRLSGQVLPSLSRLMKSGIGKGTNACSQLCAQTGGAYSCKIVWNIATSLAPGMTRDDHPNVSDQLYANYAIGQAQNILVNLPLPLHDIAIGYMMPCYV